MPVPRRRRLKPILIPSPRPSPRGRGRVLGYALNSKEQAGSDDAAVVDGEVGGIAAEAKMAVGDEAAFEEEGPDAGGGAGAEENSIVAVFAAHAEARPVDIDLISLDVV